MFFIVVLCITFAVSAADPLGCCLPSRWSGLLQQVGGSLNKNNSVSEGVAVDVRYFLLVLLACLG